MVEMKRILGKRGRTTIPYEFRRILDLKQNDVLTFAMDNECNCIVITKERICTDCKIADTDQTQKDVYSFGIKGNSDDKSTDDLNSDPKMTM